MYFKFIRISVWLLGYSHSNVSLSIRKLSLRIEKLVKLSGMTFTCQYLKECLRLCQKHVANEVTTSSSEPRVATRRGLPLIIPGELRLLLEKEGRDPKLVKLVLTILSAFRVMPAQPKLRLETITSPFSGLYKTTQEIIPVISMVKNNFLPFKGKGSYFYMDTSPNIEGRALLNLTTAGPNHKCQLLGFPLDALAFTRNPKLLKAFNTLCVFTKHQDIMIKLNQEITAWADLRNDSIKSLLKRWIIDSGDQLKLGKLSLKQEPAGKVRVFAIVDAWTQSLLAPLHKELFTILSKIPSDGTFDQIKPVKRLLDKGFKKLYSFDLSAATDRLPIDIQVDILAELFQSRYPAEAWRDLLIERDYWLKDDGLHPESKPYQYAVGQPMGALSSWGMLALTHHTIVQIAARRTGWNDWFGDYAVLGDDVVIANTQVASAYLTLMKDLGVEINLHKSLVSEKGVAEFAKKLLDSKHDYSPLGPKSLFEFIKSPLHFKDVFINYGLYHDNEETIIDGEVLVCKLQSLYNGAQSFSTHKWMRRLKSSYWDIVSYFGLNSIQDLSPSLRASAIDSLDMENLKTFNSTLDELLENKITRGWLKALESDEATYRRYRRFLSLTCYTRDFPSTQDVIRNFSEILMFSASHYLHDWQSLSQVEKVRLAYSELSRLSWAFDQPDTRRKVKSIELSKDLLFRLAQTSPSLLLEIIKTSQAVTSFNKLVDKSE
ncbi:MAG: RNA-dependent RNA polymerase [Bremia lactucae associated mitovirus 1]|nr:MAG: RNA-dependent RNA polymerase [Bremia lactucae associated mitovirus 1]